MRNGWQRTLFGWLYIRDVLSNGVYRGGICGSSEEVFGPPGEKTAPAGGRGGGLISIPTLLMYSTWTKSRTYLHHGGSAHQFLSRTLGSVCMA